MKRSLSRKSLDTSVECLNPRDDQADEAAAWPAVSDLALNALGFWATIRGYQDGTVVIGPSDAAFNVLLLAIRAVSWVESRHGTATSGPNASSAAVDPMQCGNPGDPFWKELTDCTVQQDRLIGGSGCPNYDPCKVPPIMENTPNFPDAAKLSGLTKQSNGHNDAKFSNTMSFYWGVLYLVHKINTAATRASYQCGGITTAELPNGCATYNGGGDPNYADKITAALALFTPPTPMPLDLKPRTDPQSIIATCTAEYPANKDDCNHFLKAVATDLSITLFQPADDANTIVARLINAATAPSVSGWTQLTDGTAAKQSADAGLFVVAGLQGSANTPPVAHGHVAVVVSGPLATAGPYPTGYWGSLNGVPGAYQTLNYAWNSNSIDSVLYFSTPLASFSQNTLNSRLQGPNDTLFSRTLGLLQSAQEVATSAGYSAIVEVEVGSGDEYMRVSITLS